MYVCPENPVISRPIHFPGGWWGLCKDWAVDWMSWPSGEVRVMQGCFFRKADWQLSYCLPNSSSSPLVLSEKRAALWYKTNRAGRLLGRCSNQGSLAKEQLLFGEERDLLVWVARARSSSQSLARLFECSSVWGLGTNLLMPGWCLLTTAYTRQQGVKFRDRITVQQRGAQISMFSSPLLTQDLSFYIVLTQQPISTPYN